MGSPERSKTDDRVLRYDHFQGLSPEDAEDVNMYKEGGFHPIHIGDMLGERFEVFYKLGHGGFGTVWLCLDHRSDKWRAVKVATAEYSSTSREIRIFQHLMARFSRDELTSNYIEVPLETFWIDGPNGRHLCSVMHILGYDLESWSWTLKPIKVDIASRTKEVCCKLVRGMYFLHNNGVCHGDFRLQNILMRTRGLEDLSRDQMTQLIKKGVEADPYYRTKGTGDGYLSEETDGEEAGGEETNGEPYLDQYRTPFPDSGLPCVITFPLKSRAGPNTPLYCVRPLEPDWCKDFLAVEPAITDFGESFFTNEPKSTIGIPNSHAAPEVLFETDPPGPSSDVWALACCLYELWGRKPLFGGGRGGGATVRSWEVMIGPLPEPFRKIWESREIKTSYYEGEAPDPNNPDRLMPAACKLKHLEEARKDMIARAPGYTDVLEAKLGIERVYQPWDPEPSMVAFLDDEGTFHHRYPRDEVLQLADLLRGILKYDPSARSDIATVLRHPWVAGCPIAPIAPEDKQGSPTWNLLKKICRHATSRNALIPLGIAVAGYLVAGKYIRHRR